MDNFYVQVLFWVMLALMLACSFYIPRRMMKKKKQLDERFTYVDHLARSYGWMGSLVVIFVAWFLSLAVFKSLLVFWFVTAIYVGHMLSYLIGAAVAHSRN